MEICRDNISDDDKYQIQITYGKADEETGEVYHKIDQDKQKCRAKFNPLFFQRFRKFRTTDEIDDWIDEMGLDIAKCYDKIPNKGDNL